MIGSGTLVMSDRGRIVIPADVRERHGFTTGTPIVLVETEQGLLLTTRDQLLARVRADCAGHGLVDSLIADRRAEAARDVEP